MCTVYTPFSIEEKKNIIIGNCFGTASSLTLWQSNEIENRRTNKKSQYQSIINQIKWPCIEVYPNWNYFEIEVK